VELTAHPTPPAGAAPTEFHFELPHGLRDGDHLHKKGVMRMSTAFDEIAPLKDARVQANPGYLVIILMSRVVSKLGSVQFINPKVIEALPSGDLVYLQDFYRRINENGHSRLAVTCPHCSGDFEVETSSMGES
jgi:hypothetical protein